VRERGVASCTVTYHFVHLLRAIRRQMHRFIAQAEFRRSLAHARVDHGRVDGDAADNLRRTLPRQEA
jgi:hypothetical protein